MGLKHLNSARGWITGSPEIIWVPTNNDELVVGVDNIAPVSLVEEGGERKVRIHMQDIICLVYS